MVKLYSQLRLRVPYTMFLFEYSLKYVLYYSTTLPPPLSQTRPYDNFGNFNGQLNVAFVSWFFYAACLLMFGMFKIGV